jgi:hypothetical protein
MVRGCGYLGGVQELGTQQDVDRDGHHAERGAGNKVLDVLVVGERRHRGAKGLVGVDVASHRGYTHCLICFEYVVLGFATARDSPVRTGPAAGDDELAGT